MRKYMYLFVLSVVAAGTFSGVMAQKQLSLQPADPAFNPAKNKEAALLGGPKTLVCNDTLIYPLAKEQVLIATPSFFIFEAWQADNEAISQAFLLSGSSVSVSGVEFFGRKAPSVAGTITVTASIFNVNAQNVPTTLIGSGTVNITDTIFGFRTVTFANPLTVSGNFAVVLAATSPGGIVQFYVNNIAPGQIQDEGLSRYRSNYYQGSNGQFVSIPNVGLGNFDFEALVAPIVSYTINTNFTTSPANLCAGAPVNFTGTTTPAGVLNSRFFNFNRFLQHFNIAVSDSTFVYDVGVAPQTLLWQANASYTYANPGNYNVTHFTLGGFLSNCLDQQTNPIIVGTVPAAPGAISGPVSLCAQGAANYQISPVAGATGYAWTLPAGWTGTNTGLSISVQAGNTGGNVSVAATNACGTGTSTSVAVAVNFENPAFAYPSSTICLSGSNPVPTVSSPGSFTSSPAGLNFANAATGEINILTSQAGSYLVTYTTSGPCPQSSSQTITLTVNPSATFSYSQAGYCLDAVAQSPVFGPGASAGTFSSLPSGLNINSSTGQITPASSQPGVYTVTNTIPASGSCPQASATAQVEIKATPTVSIDPASAEVCEGSSVTLTASGAATYQWQASPDLNTLTGAVVQATPSVNSFYTVTGTGANQCTASAVVSVTVKAVPDVQVTPTSAQVCAGGSVNLSASGALTYEWSPVAGLSSVTDPAVSASPESNITYVVTGTAANQCTASASVNVIVLSLPQVTLDLPVSDSLCLNAQALTLSGGLPAGGTYSGTGVSALSFNPAGLAPGVYTITYTYQDANNCINTADDQIIVGNCYLSLGENLLNGAVSVFPNPAADAFVLSVQLNDPKPVTVDVFSATGQLVWSAKFGAVSALNETINSASWAAGVYFLRIQAGESQATHKILRR